MNYKTLAIFFAGVGIGALVSRLYLKEKYEKILDMEIERVNSAYEKEMEEARHSKDEEVKEDESQLADEIAHRVQADYDRKVYRHEVAKQAYDSYFKKEEEPTKAMAPIEPVEEPYVITGNEFITDQAHDKETLTYYINAKILVDDNDEMLDVPATEILGDEFISHFHDGEVGVVYVRNNKMGVDYEVILDESSEEFVREDLGFGDK